MREALAGMEYKFLVDVQKNGLIVNLNYTSPPYHVEIAAMLGLVDPKIAQLILKHIDNSHKASLLRLIGSCVIGGYCLKERENAPFTYVGQSETVPAATAVQLTTAERNGVEYVEFSSPVPNTNNFNRVLEH